MAHVWRMLTAEERFLLKAFELQSRGEARTGAYPELARGFGHRDNTAFLAGTKAHQTRLHPPTSRGRRLPGAGRHRRGRHWLGNEAGDYWGSRKTLIALLHHLARFEHSLPGGKTDGASARLLAGASENDHR